MTLFEFFVSSFWYTHDVEENYLISFNCHWWALILFSKSSSSFLSRELEFLGKTKNRERKRVMAPNTEKSNNNDFTLLQVHDSDSPMFPEKQKATSRKQFTWFLLLKLHRVLTCLSWLTNCLKATFALVKKRVSLADMSDEGPKSRGRLYRFIKIFLALSIGGLAIEIIAHFNKWNLHNMIQPWEVQGLLQWCYVAWLSFREDYVAPLVLMVSKFCIVLFLIQSLDRLVLCLGCFWIKYKKLKPTFEADACDVEDPSNFPMVLVQIPMCNEREVTESILQLAITMIKIMIMIFFIDKC